ncbi:MAG TPA: hypothetical protein VMF70_05660, partial [Gemmatimonadales bacterium]|nr:hypothetical protein [Gemmatimonadales bacterium]
GYTLIATSRTLPPDTSNAFAVTAGAATQLLFTQQPSHVSAGAIMSPAVLVTVADAQGKAVPTASGTVSLALTGPSGATLTGGGATAVASGVATFSGLSVNLVGTYTLTPTTTVAGVTTLPVSFPFAVLPSPASHLVLTQPAAGAASGAAFTVQPVVAVEDGEGNTVTSDNTTVVTMAVTMPPGATVVGTANALAVNGVATFTNVGIAGIAGIAYTLAFSAGGLTPYVQPITLTAGAASHLALTTPAAGAASGAAFTVQPVVTVQDAGGNRVTSDNSTVVTMAVTMPPGATVVGTATATATSGVATFTNVGISGTAGTSYTLTYTASAPVLTPATQSITLTAGAAAQLVFTVQPRLTPVLVAISPAVQVTAQDASGNTATAFAGNVTVGITNGTGTTGALLGGTVTQAAVNGVATFANLTIDAVGTGYTLTGAATGLPNVTSSAFNTSCPAANDGVLCEPGWATATTWTFNANLPGGGTVPATIYAWNDVSNLHLAIRVPYVPGTSEVEFDFDNTNIGALQADTDALQSGDDILSVNDGGFGDDFWQGTCPSLPGPVNTCSGQSDNTFGGTIDGSGALHSNGSFTVYELSHPLNSGDTGHDFSLASGQTVGMYVRITLRNYPLGADTYYPPVMYLGPGLQVLIK